MIRGIYSAAAGMVTESLRNDTIANNLANVSTAGYKKDVAISKDFASVLIQRINDGPSAPVIGSVGSGSQIDEVATIHSNGSVHVTGNAFDLAIEGKGFFVINTPNGLRYTRNGTFTQSAQGELVNSEGYRVMGQNGPLRVNGKQMVVGDDGRVTVDGVEVGRLQLVEFADEKQLAKEGANLFAAQNGAQSQPATGVVRQGSLEMSNVNVVAEMVNLINGFRAYEINGKAVQASDGLLEKAVNDVGRV